METTNKPKPRTRRVSPARMEKIMLLLRAAHVSCQEAIDGTWDKSDSGFEAMQWGLEQSIKLLRTAP